MAGTIGSPPPYITYMSTSDQGPPTKRYAETHFLCDVRLRRQSGQDIGDVIRVHICEPMESI